MRVRWARLPGWVLCAGSVLFSSCLARVQGNLDLLLGAGALENALRLPYSAVAPLLRLFIGVM